MQNERELNALSNWVKNQRLAFIESNPPYLLQQGVRIRFCTMIADSITQEGTDMFPYDHEIGIRLIRNHIWGALYEVANMFPGDRNYDALCREAEMIADTTQRMLRDGRDKQPKILKIPRSNAVSTNTKSRRKLPKEKWAQWASKQNRERTI